MSYICVERGKYLLFFRPRNAGRSDRSTKAYSDPSQQIDEADEGYNWGMFIKYPFMVSDMQRPNQSWSQIKDDIEAFLA